MHLPVEITTEITEHFANHLDRYPTDYVCVYGSSVYSPDKLTSDVDMFMVTKTAGSLALRETIEFVQDLHKRHGRTLDEEVPYENKINYTDPEIKAAVQFSGFQVVNENITVPPIQKTTKFLSGPEIKARLLLNALTTPHSAIGNDFTHYHHVRKLASGSIALLGVSLLREEEFTIDTVLTSLTDNPSGVSGEMYLGYKNEYPIVREHLYGALSGALDRLKDDGVINETGDVYHIDRSTFDPIGYMKSKNT